MPGAMPKLKEFNDLRPLNTKDDFLEPSASQNKGEYTSHNRPTACLRSLNTKDDFLHPSASQNKGEYTPGSFNCLFHRRA